MRAPQRRGTAISPARRRQWLQSFPGYRHVITDEDIGKWLNQFQRKHRDIAARILDAVEYVTADDTTNAYRNLLTALPRWHRNANQRAGTWKFVPYSISGGESADSMMHPFRTANNLAGKQYNSLFAHWSQLASMGPEDTIVFVDDFSGTGSQVKEYWDLTFAELLASGPTAYLLLTAATTTAQTNISKETSLSLRAGRLFDSSDDIFASDCKSFSKDEKDALLKYCLRASPQEPRGRGSSGLLVVLAHKAPNNSIPVLHKVNQQWTGLFRRYN